MTLGLWPLRPMRIPTPSFIAGRKRQGIMLTSDCCLPAEHRQPQSQLRVSRLNHDVIEQLSPHRYNKTWSFHVNNVQ